MPLSSNHRGHRRTNALHEQASSTAARHIPENPLPVAQNEILQLQRSIGNHATFDLIQSSPPAGAGMPNANQVLSLQRAVGNQAVTRLLTRPVLAQGQNGDTLQRWLWSPKPRPPTPDTMLGLFDPMRNNPGAPTGHATPQKPLPIPPSTTTATGHTPPRKPLPIPGVKRPQKPLPTLPSVTTTGYTPPQKPLPIPGVKRPQKPLPTRPPRPFLANITPNPKKIVDPDHAEIIEDLSLTSTTTDAIGSALSNAGSTVRSGLYDSIYQSFLQEQGLPPGTDPSSLTSDQRTELEQRQIEGGGLRTITANAGARTDLGIASSGLGIGIAGFTTFAGFLGLIDAWKKFKNDTDPKKRFDLFMELVSQGTVAVIGTLQTATSVSSTVSGIVSKYQPENSAASMATSASGGLGDLLGGLGGMVEMFVSGIKAIRGAFNLFRGLGEGSKREQAMQIASDFIKSGKAFLMTGKSVISGVKGFLDVFGKANAFTSSVPIVGAAINIVVQFVDIALQVIDGVRQAIKLAIARRTAEEMRQLQEQEQAKGTGASPDRLAYLRKMVEINIKRVKRAVIPLVTAITNSIANVISIAGSILNIVGAATSAAYGAGLALMATGYAASGTSALMRLAGAAAKPIAAAIRKIKQLGRDQAAKKPTGILAKLFKFNANKSTEKKNAEYVANAQRLFDMITALPAKFDANNQQEKQQYQEVYVMLEATGVEVEELFKSNGEPKKQMLMIIEAMQKRE